jgi:arsenate reductase
MSTVRVYHNPGCSKSRGVVNLLREREVDLEIREYLQKPLDRAELDDLLRRLNTAPSELVRRDSNFDALGLDAGDYTTAEAVIALLVAHPKLMQRPIAVCGERAVIARPSEKVLELL